MEISGTEKYGHYEVTGATIRGFDWVLVRKPGVGTYAIVAGEDDASDDENIVIEEEGALDRRALWDAKSHMEVAEIVFETISSQIA